MNDEVPVDDEMEFNYGRGARERTRIKDDCGLTKEQWLDAIDADNNTIEEAVARKQARIAKRAAKKDSLEGKGGIDSPSASRASSESPAPNKPAEKPAEKQKGESRGSFFGMLKLNGSRANGNSSRGRTDEFDSE